jgi:2-keto-3-deoxy-L-rhamnonate aldolase RhmA
MVRVPGCHYHLIAPVLDAGAMGIMVPMVETPAQAQQIASWCHYRPEGVRGVAFGMPHDDYGSGDVVQKLREAHERTLVIALIETALGIANAEAIMAVDGIDIGWLGHFDLTNSMGIPGQFEHPDFLAAVDRLIAACRAHAKPAGVLAGSVEAAEAWRTRGFRLFAYGTDISLLCRCACRSRPKIPRCGLAAAHSAAPIEGGHFVPTYAQIVSMTPQEVLDRSQQ